MSNSLFKGTPIAKGFATDKAAERDGVWRDHDSGISVRIRRSTLPEHKRALRRHFKPFTHLSTIDPTQELLVKQKAAAEVLVADWGVKVTVPAPEGSAAEPSVLIEPLKSEEGAVIACNQDNILAAFVEMPDFFTWVTEEADTFEHYRLGMVRDAGGNLRPISDGTESGGPLSTSLSGEQPGASPSLPSA